MSATHPAPPAKLYFVLQETRRPGYATLLWFTHAKSKADAVRNYLSLVGNAGAPFMKPTAHLLTTGGPVLRI